MVMVDAAAKQAKTGLAAWCVRELEIATMKNKIPDSNNRRMSSSEYNFSSLSD